MSKIVAKLEEIEEFSNIITEIVHKDRISYIDAITEYCDTHEIDIEIAAKLLNQFIISKIRDEAMSSNMLEKVNVLKF